MCERSPCKPEKELQSTAKIAVLNVGEIQVVELPISYPWALARSKAANLVNLRELKDRVRGRNRRLRIHPRASDFKEKGDSLFLELCDTHLT